MANTEGACSSSTRSGSPNGESASSRSSSSEKAQLSVAIAAGGTAGHINPALALAEELTARGHSVRFYGQPQRLEGTLVPQAGFELFPLDVTGFNRSHPLTALTSVRRVIRARRKLSSFFSEVGAPDVAIGFGAYVEIPLLSWCASHRIPLLIHEQNSVVGLANKLMAARCARVCAAFPAAAEALKKYARKDAIVLTGNPVRRSVLDADRAAGRRLIQATDEDCVLLVFGGSLGARHINEGIQALKAELLTREKLHIVHATGMANFDWVEQELNLSEEERRRWHLMPYIDDMGSMLAAADCVLSRAGASSVAEIAAMSVPSLLIPYPIATGDHQTVNAHFLVDAGAAQLLADSDIDTERFPELLFELIDNAELRSNMRQAAQKLPSRASTQILADQLEEVAQHRG